MSAEIEAIIEEIEAEASLHTELDELESNPSLVGFWIKSKQIFAMLIRSLKVQHETYKNEVNALIDKTETGLIDWMRVICLSYQHGDSLIVQNNRLVYNVINPAIQIIKRVAIYETDTGGYIVVQVRVVKEVDGAYAPLSDTELSAFSAYLQKQKFAGTALNIESSTADILKVLATVELDKSLFSDDGHLIADPTAEPVLDTINTYLKNFDFGGTFYASKLIDTIMEIEGVNDFHITSKTLNAVAFTSKTFAPSGHIALDPTSTMTYVLL